MMPSFPALYSIFLKIWIAFLSLLVLGMVMVPARAFEKGKMNSGGADPLILLADTLSLPFFDDFSYAGQTPRAEYWQLPTNATVSRRVAVLPPTIGVLRFDAARADGTLYTHQAMSALLADTLVSKPISFASTIDTSVYLSFWFQPGGNGGAPLLTDTLFLDFHSPQKAEWNTVLKIVYDARNRQVRQSLHLPYSWPAQVIQEHDNPTSHFFRAHIPIRGKDYLAHGFRFRFRNIASLQVDKATPSRSGNSSYWHIDMVHIDAGRNYDDSLTRDVACITQPSFVYSSYESIPFKAFAALLANRPAARIDSLVFSYTNLDDQVYNVRRQFLIEDLTGVLAPYGFSAGSENLLPMHEARCKRTFSYPWRNLLDREIHLRLTAFLTTDTSRRNAPFRWNDTVWRDLHFTNEYAYDTGSADQGYGIVGIGAEKASAAVRFSPLAETVLVGVKIWFNQIINPETRKNIKLSIWSEHLNRPAELVYEQLITPPQRAEDLDRFMYYPLRTPLLFDKTYYIGWTQLTSDMVNIGVDLQVSSPPVTFYKTTGSWLASDVRGAIMLRPVCDDSSLPLQPSPPTSVEDCEHIHWNIYPNPSNGGQLMVECEVENATFSIFNMTGYLIAECLAVNTLHQLDFLPKGVYIIRLFRSEGVVLGSGKIVFQ